MPHLCFCWLTLFFPYMSVISYHDPMDHQWFHAGNNFPRHQLAAELNRQCAYSIGNTAF